MLPPHINEIDYASESFIPPESPQPTPLLILLHGAGRDGKSQLDVWRPLAESENIHLLAPTSLAENKWWGYASRDFEVLNNKINYAIFNWRVDRRRVYLAGHSIGGHLALSLGFRNPEQITAVASHSPYMAPTLLREKFEPDTRKVPAAIWVGDEESDGNYHGASALCHFLKEDHSIALELHVIRGHLHNDYYTRKSLPGDMWAFLKDKTLPEQRTARNSHEP